MAGTAIAQGATRIDHAAIAARIIHSAQAGAQHVQSRLAHLGDRLGSGAGALVQQFHASGSAVEQGAILRALDRETGGRAGTESALAEFAAGKSPAAKNPLFGPPKYDASSLYGAGGPSANDIEQNSFGDCYYVATLGAVANENPNMIRNAISYDAKTQSFNVTLYDANGQPQVHNVTQAEIDANIAMGGGSRRDNGVAGAPIWPDVMEVAYAKQLDTNHADGLTEGYTDLGNGGWPKDAMRAITGDEGHSVRYDQGFFESRSSAMDEVGNQIKDALANDKPVTAWSVPEHDSRSLWGRLRGHDIKTEIDD